MLLTQILKPSCIKAPLAGTDKESVIEELINLLNENKLLTDKADVLDAVLAREMTRSTGIGSGIAIPHGKCKGVNDLVMAVGIVPQDIEFDSIDGKGVRIIVLLVSPLGKTGPHIQALARISRLMLDEDLRNGLINSKNAADVYHLIKDKERE